MRKCILLCTVQLVVCFTFLSAHSNTQAQRKRLGSSSVSSSLSLDQQAEQQARAFWSARITKCNEDYYTRDRAYIHDFRNLNVRIESRPISGADRLNGIQWMGYTTAIPVQSRTYSPQSSLYQNTGWSDWSEGYTMAMGGVELRAELQKARGRWLVTPSSISQAGVLEAVTCAEVANPLESYRNWKRRKEAQKLNTEVQEFLRIAESYWHIYSSDLPADMYKFMAKNPNTLHRLVFFPNDGWAIIGNYNAVSNNLPDDMQKAVNEGRDLSSLAVSPKGGWVMLNRDYEKNEEWIKQKLQEFARGGRSYKEDEVPTRRGFASNNLRQDISDTIWRLYNSWNRIDLIRFTPEGECVIIFEPNYGRPDYLLPGEHAFGYWPSKNLPENFKTALNKLMGTRKISRINDIAFTATGGYVIVYNDRGYSFDGIPDKMMEAIKYWSENGSGYTASTGVSIGLNDEWVVYNSK